MTLVSIIILYFCHWDFKRTKFGTVNLMAYLESILNFRGQNLTIIMVYHGDRHRSFSMSLVLSGLHPWVIPSMHQNMSLFSPYYIIMSLIYHCIILLKWNSDSLSTRRQHSATENCPLGIRSISVNKSKGQTFIIFWLYWVFQLTLVKLNFLRKFKSTFKFSIILWHSDGAGSWNHSLWNTSLWNTRNCVS